MLFEKFQEQVNFDLTFVGTLLLALFQIVGFLKAKTSSKLVYRINGIKTQSTNSQHHINQSINQSIITKKLQNATFDGTGQTTVPLGLLFVGSPVKHVHGNVPCHGPDVPGSPEPPQSLEGKFEEGTICQEDEGLTREIGGWSWFSFRFDFFGLQHFSELRKY